MMKSSQVASARPDQAGLPAEAVRAAAGDTTGREDVARNVLASWGGHLVIVAVGFVLPRVIDETLGQERLGVWDFAWAFVAWFGLVQAGFISSINRFVAQHRAANNIEGINRVLRAANAVLGLMSVAVATASVVSMTLVSALWSERLGPWTGEAQWTVLLLGMAVAMEIGSAGFSGVITGCHRWDLHNAVYAATSVLSAALMIAAALLGGGLIALAGSYLLGETAGRAARVWLAYRVCPGLSASGGADGKTARQMLHFGAKTFVPQLGELVLTQGIALVILGMLGPAALAIFTRPRSLIRHSQTFVAKLSHVLVPTSSALQSIGAQEALRDLLVQSTRASVYVALPVGIVLAVLGGPLLHAWMGPDYAVPVVTAILGLGSLPMIAHQPALSLLAGLNAHGRIGMANCAASLVSLLLAVAMIRAGAGLAGAALAVVVLPIVVSTVFIPWAACKAVRLSMIEYYIDAWRRPIACCIPFGACLAIAAWLFADRPLLALAAGLGAGMPILTGLYWSHALPQSVRAQILRRFTVRHGESYRGAGHSLPVS